MKKTHDGTPSTVIVQLQNNGQPAINNLVYNGQLNVTRGPNGEIKILGIKAGQQLIIVMTDGTCQYINMAPESIEYQKPSIHAKARISTPTTKTFISDQASARITRISQSSLYTGSHIEFETCRTEGGFKTNNMTISPTQTAFSSTSTVRSVESGQKKGNTKGKLHRFSTIYLTAMFQFCLHQFERCIFFNFSRWIIR